MTAIMIIGLESGALAEWKVSFSHVLLVEQQIRSLNVSFNDLK